MSSRFKNAAVPLVAGQLPQQNAINLAERYRLH